MLLAVVGDLGRDVLPVLLVYLVDFLHLEYEDDPLEPLLGGGGEQLDNVLHDMPVHQLVGPEKDHVYFDPHFVRIPVQTARLVLSDTHSRLLCQKYSDLDFEPTVGLKLPASLDVCSFLIA